MNCWDIDDEKILLNGLDLIVQGLEFITADSAICYVSTRRQLSTLAHPRTIALIESPCAVLMNTIPHLSYIIVDPIAIICWIIVDVRSIFCGTSLVCYVAAACRSGCVFWLRRHCRNHCRYHSWYRSFCWNIFTSTTITTAGCPVVIINPIIECLTLPFAVGLSEVMIFVSELLLNGWCLDVPWSAKNSQNCYF